MGISMVDSSNVLHVLHTLPSESGSAASKFASRARCPWRASGDWVRCIAALSETAMARVTWRSRANACHSATDAPKRRSSRPLSLSAAANRVAPPGGAASRSLGAEGLDAGNARQPHAINFATVDDAAVHQVVEFRKTDAGHFCPRLRANPDRLDVFSGVHEISSGSFAAAQRQPGYCIRGKLSG